jgi:transcriptional regulator with XRE-family HTH domain
MVEPLVHAEPYTDHSNRQFSIGVRLREIREHRGESIRALAARVGLTASFISQVERGLAQPSVSSLFRMAAALEVSVAEVFHQVSSTSRLVRREDRRVIGFKGFEQELATPSTAELLQMSIVTLAPGGDSGPDLISDRPGEECVLVLDGSAKVSVGDERYLLRSGDSLTFQCATPHSIKNPTDKPVRLLIAHAPPNF